MYITNANVCSQRGQRTYSVPVCNEVNHNIHYTAINILFVGMARPQRTQQQPGTYTYEQLPGLMVAADEALFPQLFAAADFVAQMLQANGIPYAFMGGFALKLRGSTRDTHDVDVTVECTMLRLIEVLSGQPRYVNH